MAADSSEIDYEIDLLVVGAGPAGATAALVAWGQGAEVLLVERDTRVGGATRYAGSNMLFAGTPEQAAAEVQDSPEMLLSDWSELTQGGDPEDPWVQLFARRQLDVRDHLVGLGLELSVLVSTHDEVPRSHRLAGRPALDLVVWQVDAMDPDCLRLSSEVVDLLWSQGQVVGARLQHERQLEEIYARHTLLATGSYLRNLEMVRQSRPELQGMELWFGSGGGSDGAGHLLAEGAGGQWDNPGAIGIFAHGTPDPRPDMQGEEVYVSALHHGIWVDATGARFTSESRMNDLSSGADLVRLADGMMWLIIDQRQWDLMAFRPFALIDGVPADPVPKATMIEGPYVLSGETLPELALAAGMNSSTLEAEVQGFNSWVKGEVEVDPWRDEEHPPPPLEVPPYYAIRIVPSLAKAFGGIDVDTRGRVVDAAGDPIPGLLAAGELTGMAGGSLVGEEGYPGSLSAVMLGGMVAAETASEGLR